MGSVETCCFEQSKHHEAVGTPQIAANNQKLKRKVYDTTSASTTAVQENSNANKNINSNNTAANNSDSSDDDEETVQLEGRQPFSFSRKISTNKGFDKTVSAC